MCSLFFPDIPDDDENNHDNINSLTLLCAYYASGTVLRILHPQELLLHFFLVLLSQPHGPLQALLHNNHFTHSTC